MSRRGCNWVCQKALVGFMIAAALAVTVPATPATAEGFFDFLFGGFRRRPPPPPPVSVDRPNELFRERAGPNGRQEERESVRGTAGPHAAYCVRLCDGRYFPIQGRRNTSAAEQCNAFCPASPTQIFSGNEIGRAKAGDGRRYVDLPNAYLYRKSVVAGCSCNGKDRVGLASVPVNDDPTLLPGDIVATNSGFTVYNGRDPQQQTAFTPIDSAKISKSLRDQLNDVKVTPRPSGVYAEPVPGAQGDASSIRSEQRRLSARAQ